MPFIFDDMAIAAAIAAAESAAAEAAAATAAGVTASAATAAPAAIAPLAEVAAPAVAELAAPAAAEIAAPVAAEAAAEPLAGAALDSGITDAITSSANAAQGELAGSVPLDQAMAATGNAPVAPGGMDAAVQSNAEYLAGSQPPEVPLGQSMAQTENLPAAVPEAQQAASAQSNAAYLADAGANAGTGSGTGGSITDTMANYAGKVGGYLSDPKVLIPGAISAGSAAWSSAEAAAEQRRQKEISDAENERVRKEGENINAAVNSWAAENMSGDAIRRNTDSAYADLASKYDGFLASGLADPGGPSGNLSDEYKASLSSGMTGAMDDASAYAKKMAKSQAPAFANLKSNLGQLMVGRTMGDANSNMRSALGTVRANSTNPQGGEGQLGAAALRGFGRALGS